jgi:hypothetical protein
MITLEQAKALTWRDELHCGPCIIRTGTRGGQSLTQERWRVNGKIQLWKTRPDEFSLPIKHGLKTCYYLTHRNAADFHLSADCQPIVRERK